MWEDLFDGPHLLVIAIVVIVLFGWKRLPDISRSIGRSARILRSEADQFRAEQHDRSTDTPGGSAPQAPSQHDTDDQASR